MNCVRFIKTVQQRSFLKIIRANYVSQYPIKFLDTQQKYQEKDGVSKQWQLIYKAPMEKILKFVSAYLTFSTTTLSCSLIYYSVFVFDKATMHDPIIIGDDVVIANNAMECFIYLGAFVLFHVAVKILLSKYVVRLYQNGDDYLAVFRGHTYNSIKKHEFHLSEFEKLNPTLVVSWSDSRFALGKKHGILLEDYFKTPECFNRLLYKKSAKDSEYED